MEERKSYPSQLGYIPVSSDESSSNHESDSDDSGHHRWDKNTSLGEVEYVYLGEDDPSLVLPRIFNYSAVV